MENIWTQLCWNGNNMVMLTLNPNMDYPLELVRPHMDFLDLFGFERIESKRQTFNSPSKLPKTKIIVEQMVNRWIARGEQVNNEWVNRLKGTRKFFWNIFHATSTNIFGHDKIFLEEVQNILFYHVDKGPTWTHQLFF